MRRFVRWVVLGFVCLAVAGCVVPVSSRTQTCVICRKYRVDTTYAGIPWPRQYETECSRWYAAHVERQHDHIWEPGTCTYYGSFFGVGGFGCSPGHYPIHLLPSDTQMQVYQHFKNPLEAKTLFANLTDAKTHNDRLDEEDDDKGHLIVEAIAAWEGAGFPGTWDEWWGRWYGKHVAEHKEYMEWLHAESKMSFGDWQKQRKAGAK